MRRVAILFVLVTACWRSSAPPAPEPPVAQVQAKPIAVELANLVGVWTTRYPGRSADNTLTIRADGSFEAIDHGDHIVGTGRIVVFPESRTLELRYDRLVDSHGDRKSDHVQKNSIELLRSNAVRLHDGVQAITWRR